MERIGYTRLYATVSGAGLVLLGLFGMLENSEFDLAELHTDLLGIYAVNGWANALHIGVGLIALVMARSRSRLYALAAAVLFLGLGIWGVLAPNSELLFSKLPAERDVNVLNLLLGLLASAALIAGYWQRIRQGVAGRVRKRRTRTGRLERRRRRRRLKQETKTRSKSGSKTGS
ncbi:MAG: DUF4383 domain-containing protein [Actinomycetota bacterium]|nr:DUF4383 domain-containing protein [Actinomycetota bacterium]